MHGVALALTLGSFRRARRDRLDGWNVLQNKEVMKTPMKTPLLLFKRYVYYLSFALFLSHWRLTAVVFLLDGINDNGKTTTTIPVELLALCWTVQFLAVNVHNLC